MRIIGPIATPPHTLEDPLDYLPRSNIIAYKKDQLIYQQTSLVPTYTSSLRVR
jgi:hypothetical protein